MSILRTSSQCYSLFFGTILYFCSYFWAQFNNTDFLLMEQKPPQIFTAYWVLFWCLGETSPPSNGEFRLWSQRGTGSLIPAWEVISGQVIRPDKPQDFSRLLKPKSHWPNQCYYSSKQQMLLNRFLLWSSMRGQRGFCQSWHLATDTG